MTPKQHINLTSLEVDYQPSLTYGLDLERKRITGKIDNEQAILQAIMKILYTERYGYVIYSSQYGVELRRLIGKDYDFIVTDLERTISEALRSDNRILGIREFNIEQTDINSLAVSFIVESIIGLTNINMEVQI